MKIIRLVAALALGSFAVFALAWTLDSLPALAQNSWVTPGGSQANGTVMMCLNASNQPVPATAAGTCLGSSSGGGAVTNAGTFAVQNNAATPAGTNTIGNVGPLPYPVGAIPITASATGTTAATTATLAASATGKTTYICGYSIRANATATTSATNTITGVVTTTLSSIMWIPANTAGLGVDEQIFTPCIPGSATNTAIAIISAAPGTGGLVSAKGWGYQQ
jgi:hypothetical protein